MLQGEKQPALVNTTKLMVYWSSIQPHHKGIRAPSTWCTQKGLVSHYSDLTPSISYHNLRQHKMGQCWNAPAQKPAIGEGTTTKYKEQCNNNIGSSSPKQHLNINWKWPRPTNIRLQSVVKNKGILLPWKKNNTSLIFYYYQIPIYNNVGNMC